MSALAAQGLTKRFGETTAVDAVDFTVPEGVFAGLIGPNGAGKTTTVAMVTTLLAPDAGRVTIGDVDVWSELEAARARFGVMPDGRSLPARLTGREVLTYLGLLRGLPEAAVAQRAEELLAVLELTAAERTLVMNYSTGMRKKLGVAVALLHDPQLLVLDEPFEGMDPVSAAVVREILQRFVARGGTVLMTSHVMALVQRLCDHVTVIDHGHVRYSGTTGELAGSGTLDDAFLSLVGERTLDEDALAWMSH
jgi:ABC-2 type transport system ATP-binding protein